MHTHYSDNVITNQRSFDVPEKTFLLRHFVVVPGIAVVVVVVVASVVEVVSYFERKIIIT